MSRPRIDLDELPGPCRCGAPPYAHETRDGAVVCPDDPGHTRVDDPWDHEDTGFHDQFWGG